MPFRFIHTADLHLDSPLRSLALKHPDLGALVRSATRTALTRIVDLCMAERVDALLIAGDLYDGSQTSMNTALFLSAELRRLDESGIRVFIIRGNHDAQALMTRELTLPPSAHVFIGRAKPVLAGTLADGRPIQIHGMSFAQPQAPESLLPHFAAPVEGAINIGMLHTSLAGSEGHDSYAPCTVAELSRHGFDYWALGHVHKRAVHGESPYVVMPGNPQGRDINEAGVKSVTLVAIDDEGRWSLAERPVGIAAFERAIVDLTGIADWPSMLDTVAETLTQARRAAVMDHIILRLTLVGSTALNWRLRRDPDLLEAEIANLAGALGGVWIEAVENECRAEVANVPGGDPLGELAGLIDSDVLPSAGFRADMLAAVRDVLWQLPPEARAQIETDDAAAVRLAEAVAETGSAAMLAHLHGEEAS